MAGAFMERLVAFFNRTAGLLHDGTPISAPLHGHRADVDDIGEMRAAPLRHPGGATALAVAPRSGMIASGGGDDNIRLWDVAYRRQIGATIAAAQQYVKSLAFSPDQRLLASGGQDGTVRFLDVDAAAWLGQPATKQSLQVSAVAFDRSGSIVVSSSLDGTIVAWDVARRLPIGPAIRGDTSAVTVPPLLRRAFSSPPGCQTRLSSGQ